MEKGGGLFPLFLSPILRSHWTIQSAKVAALHSLYYTPLHKRLRHRLSQARERDKKDAKVIHQQEQTASAAPFDVISGSLSNPQSDDEIQPEEKKEET